jgi:hypothetical protein
LIAAAIDWRVLGTGALLILVALVLSYRLLSRDKSVKRARYGFYVERDRYDEGEVHHFDPLPPPTPPPPIPREEDTQAWPTREEGP